MTTKPKKAAKKAPPKAPAGVDDDFDQGGPDGPAKQRGGIGDNIKKFDGDELIELLETIEAAEARIKKRAEEASKKSQPDRETIAAAKKDMVKSGYPSTELATIIRRHKLQRALRDVDAKLDDDQKETFAAMVEALGGADGKGLGDTPLGKAAIARSGKKPN